MMYKRQIEIITILFTIYSSPIVIKGDVRDCQYIIVDKLHKGIVDKVENYFKVQGRKTEIINYIPTITTEFQDKEDIVLVIDMSNVNKESSSINLKDYLNKIGYTEIQIEEVENVENRKESKFFKVTEKFSMVILIVLITFLFIFIKNRKVKLQKIFKE